ncbi:MAG: DUF502 domain-containing protein [Bdellovibrionaceae bacterium]|nr:DUF502 domain-containing protein [Pseudobdellovibrionaceae bacterium]
MNSFNRIFFRGFFTLLPIALTVYIIYSAILILEGLLGWLVRAVLPEHFYVPGFGFILTLIVIFLFGLLLNNFLAERIYVATETRLLKVPFFRAIYSPLKDLMNLFSRKDTQSPQSVVLVNLHGIKMLGIVTRESFTDLNLGPVTQGHLAVYVPFSYGMGGYTLLVPREQVSPVDIPIEKAMSLAITAWVKADAAREVKSE